MNNADNNWSKNDVRNIMVAITLMTGTEMFLSGAFTVMLPDLAGALSASADEMSWAQTLYTAAYLAAIPLAMWLSSRIGHGLCLAYAASVFTITTFVLALTYNLDCFLILRILQGLAGGMFLVRSQITMYNIVPRRFLGYILLWFCIGVYGLRAMGGWYGGWMTDTLSWRWAFAGAGLISLAGWRWTNRYLRPLQTNDKTEVGLGNFKFPFLMIVGLIAAQFVLSRGEIDDWFGGWDLTILGIVSLVSLFYGFRKWSGYFVETNHLAQVNRPSLITGLPLSFLAGILFSAALASFPAFLRAGGRHSAAQVGWLSLFDGGSAAVFIVFCIRWCLPRYKNRNTLICGVLCCSVGVGWLSIFLTSVYPDWIFIFPFIVHGAFIGFFVPALDYGTQVRIDREAIPFSSTTYYLFRAMGQSTGFALLARIQATRMTFHSNRIGEHVTILSDPYRTYSAAAHAMFGGVGLSSSSASQATLRNISNLLRQQVVVLASADSLVVMAVIGVLFALLAWVTFDRDIDPFKSWLAVNMKRALGRS